MQERQYLITEAQLNSLLEQAKQSTVDISVDEMIFENQATLDVFFDNPQSEQISSKFSFPQGMPIDEQ